MKLTRDNLVERDQTSRWARYRNDFLIPERVLYFNAQCLGPAPCSVSDRLHELVHEQWGKDIIKSWWKHSWLEWPIEIGNKIAKLIGASDGEVLVGESTTTNLFKMISAAVQLQKGRKLILIDKNSFTTEHYAAQSVANLLDNQIEVKSVPREDLEDLVDDNVALVMLSHVTFEAGAKIDMKRLNDRCHSVGALTLWDLSHSAGVLPVSVTEDEVDIAVGCGYKYLHGGPGSPAFMYINKRLHNKLQPTIRGWLGHAEPFAYEFKHRPAPGVRGHITGTPFVLGLAALDEGVTMMMREDIQTVRAASTQLTQLFADLMQSRCAGLGFELVSPSDSSQRGAHLSFSHSEFLKINEMLYTKGVISDVRHPNLLRFGIVPFHTRAQDIWDLVEILKECAMTVNDPALADAFSSDGPACQSFRPSDRWEAHA